MKTVKVLHFIHALSGGGAERQLRLLVDNLGDYDVEAAVFCADDTGNDIKDHRVKVFKVLPEDRYSLRFFSVINKAIKEFEPDVVHTWLPASMTVPALILSRWNRIPIVFSFRNRRYFHTIWTYPEYILAAMFASKIITNNPVEQSILPFRKLYFRKNGELIPNAVSIDEKYIKSEILEQKFVCNILFAGRLTYQKNIELLLEALSLVDDENWRLTVCGDGEDKDKVIELANTLGVKDKVFFKGYCSDLYSVMLNSDMLIFPSRFEGMPNVLIEALEIGLPCLVSNILPHKHLLGDEFTDFMFDPDDVNDLRNKINCILMDKSKLVAMAGKGRRIVRALKPGIMANKYAVIYKNILKSSKLK